MISLSRLRDSLVGDRVAFDERGEALEGDVPASSGPATLLVGPVTDAVKRRDGDAVVSLDRDAVWVVVGIVLDREVLQELGEDEIGAGELLEAVERLGYTWQVIPTSAL